MPAPTSFGRIRQHVTDIDDAPAQTAPVAARAPRGKKGSLNTLLLPELQQIASGLGINTAKVKKSDLIAAIQTARGGVPADDGAASASRRPQRDSESQRDSGRPSNDVAHGDGAAPADGTAAVRPDRSDRPAGGDTKTTPDAEAPPSGRPGRPSRAGSAEPRADARAASDGQRETRGTGEPRGGSDARTAARNNGGNSTGSGGSGSGPSRTPNRDDDYGDSAGGGRSRRGRRYRDRRGRNRDRDERGSGGADVEPIVSEDDVLVPVAGILDAVEEKNTWFVRTGGYFASPEDVYVANSYVRRFNLRRGDAVTGAVRQPREGERREKYNPLVRLDSVNGAEPEPGKSRVEFTKLTPLYPQERLRLETEPHIFTTRVIDLVMPIGKGQRALIVSPPKAGKTMVLQAIANAIATNNPECHLMVVLIDERPEEVTDMQRSVKGEVIASTFDRRPQDHITVAELSIERAKRLVEMGHDVVVLLDSITRLGRAYNLGAPASGRILSGGVDSTALYPPKRFLGAARNIENGGSLTILATALVETGSAGDTVIFEEFKGTGNAELKLDRKIADKRVFPAVDVDQSSTRKEELLLSPDELAVTIKLRRVLHALDSQQAIDLLLDRLKKTRTNIEFLMQIAKSTPGQD
jgi:transcription termination factor Rho